jgi:hypothetical protein
VDTLDVHELGERFEVAFVFRHLAPGDHSPLDSLNE